MASARAAAQQTAPNTVPGQQNLNQPNTAAIKPTNTTTQPPQPAQPQISPENASEISFEESAFDFGTLTDGEQVEHVFKFANTSDKPLTITNARGSCGCTVPEWPKEPVAPGEEGEIKVKFNSKGKKGKQTKTVTITANTIPANTQLTISSEVLAAEGDDNGEVSVDIK
ncbi:MAG: DUF1573 domain-containing protein [Aureispira sp.]|nr:DUF1573 domain-containing protein [Aureispira sp.]